MRSMQEPDGGKKKEGHGPWKRRRELALMWRPPSSLARPPARSAAICAALQPTLGHGHGRAFLSWLGVLPLEASAGFCPEPSHYKEALYFPRRFCLFCRAARPAAVVSHLRPPWPGSPLPGFSSSSSGGGSGSSEAARAAVRAGRSARLIIGAATAAPRGGGGRPELHLLRLGQHPSSAPLKPHPTRPPETPIDLGLCGTPN